MCGIWIVEGSIEQLPAWLIRRGPDEQHRRQLGGFGVAASVLGMRSTSTAQPLQVEGALLCWNGELYQHVMDKQVWDDSLAESDTVLVGQWLAEACRAARPDQRLAALAEALGRLSNAEYSLAWVEEDTVYYARDRFGRRSLTWSENPWQLASVGGPQEVLPGHLYCYRNGATTSVPIAAQQPVMERPLMDSLETAVDELELRLAAAVRRRLSGPASILFSGGLDSAVLAALACRHEHRFTLVNVAFVTDDTDPSISSDTAAARASFIELQQSYPAANIHLLERRVDWATIVAQEPHIRTLISPKTSVMDVNIGSALWFAADAAPTRLLLTGLGADEQLGGYGRHRKAYEQGGTGALRKELDLDLGRLWERNLGRDDRVLSDCGKEARFPFLDPAVVDFLAQLPLDLVVDYSLKPGVGDKRLLRVLAQRLGLATAASAVKRAIQFGSRMSHVADKQRFGSRRKATGEAQYQ